MTPPAASALAPLSGYRRIAEALLLALPLLTMAACATTSGDKPSPAPVRLSLERYDGGTFHLADQRGKVVLLNFFATWCAPCIEELPFLNQLQERYRSQGLVVAAISMDLDGRTILEPFLEHFRLNFPVLLAAPGYFKGRTPFGPIPVLPTTIVLDREGKVVGAQGGILHIRNTDSFIRRLLQRGRSRGLDSANSQGLATLTGSRRIP